MKIKISALDSKFSFYIRFILGNGICWRCGKQYKHPTSGLHCSHFHGRAKKSTRFDVDNCKPTCHGCHAYLTANPEEHRSAYLKVLGQKKYDLLVIRANTPQKPDYKMVNLWLDMEIKKWEENQNVLGKRA